MATDPRTGFALKTFPDQANDKLWANLREQVVYWFGDAKKYNRAWKAQERLYVITDHCIYVGHQKKEIRRCQTLHDVTKVYHWEALNTIGLQINPNNQQFPYDMLFQCLNAADYELILDILKKIFNVIQGRKVDFVKQTGKVEEAKKEELLTLNKPEPFEVVFGPSTDVKEIPDLIPETSPVRTPSPELTIYPDVDPSAVDAEMNRMKEAIQAELQSKNDGDNDEMTDQLYEAVRALEDRDQVIAEKERELQQLQRHQFQHEASRRPGGGQSDDMAMDPQVEDLKHSIMAEGNPSKIRLIQLEDELGEMQHLTSTIKTCLNAGKPIPPTLLNGMTRSLAQSQEDAKDEMKLEMELKQARAKIDQLERTILNRELVTNEDQYQGKAALMRSEAERQKDKQPQRNAKIVCADLQEQIDLEQQRHDLELNTFVNEFQHYDASMLEYLCKLFQHYGQHDAGGLAERTVNSARLHAVSTGPLLVTLNNNKLDKSGSSTGLAGGPAAGVGHDVSYYKAVDKHPAYIPASLAELPKMNKTMDLDRL